MEVTTKNGYTFQVDEQDYELAIRQEWHGYISRQRRTNGDWRKARKYITRHIYKDGKRTTEEFHRVILNVQKGFEIDHINGDTLDNRRSNLRICTKSGNMRNRSVSINNIVGYKGVGFIKKLSKWNARIRVDNKLIYLGLFCSKEDAALAYNEAALKYWGEFARLNEIKQGRSSRWTAPCMAFVKTYFL